MPPTITNAFKTWLKRNVNTKLISDASVIRVTYEGTISFESLTDFYKTSIEYLPRTCREKIIAITEDVPAGITTESEVPCVNIGTISVQRLSTVIKTAMYYQLSNQAMIPVSMYTLMCSQPTKLTKKHMMISSRRSNRIFQ